MKKTIIFILAVVLTACSSAPVTAPVEQAAPAVVEPTQTPVVIVQTVVVESTPVPVEVQPTAEPPTAAPIIVNVVVPTSAPVDTGANTNASPDPNAPITLDSALGGGVFTNMTMSSNALTLRCFPREITFNVTTPNIDVVDVVFYYRTVDLKRLYPSEWKAFGKKMTANGGGNFTLTFTGENVDPNLRIDGSWLDFQFVGLNKGGSVVDRSEKIQELVKYTFECP